MPILNREELVIKGKYLGCETTCKLIKGEISAEGAAEEFNNLLNQLPKKWYDHQWLRIGT